jgi:hypothetical protein
VNRSFVATLMNCSSFHESNFSTTAGTACHGQLKYNTIPSADSASRTMNSLTDTRDQQPMPSDEVLENSLPTKSGLQPND